MLGLAADSSIGNFVVDQVPNIDLDTFDDSDGRPGRAEFGVTSVSPFNTDAATIQPTIEAPTDTSIPVHDNTHDESPSSGIGAGPLPTGFGVQLPSNTGSTLTDFTKRRNWSQRVVEEIKDLLHILTPDGRLMYVSPSAHSLTGYENGELVGKLIATFIHPDDCGMYMREFNESIASGNPSRFFYRFKKADDTYTIFESHGHPHFSSDMSNLGGSGHAVSFCRGFFMMSRPYPTNNAGLLDSFLEHKIESERLKRRIADLRREEQEDLQQPNTGGPSAYSGSQGIHERHNSLSATPFEQHNDLYQSTRTSSSGDPPYASFPRQKFGQIDYHGMPPPAKPYDSDSALTQRNLNEALADSEPDSINDKMARYEGSNHLEGIEMLTGLKYREGERSQGISTGAKSPVLERGPYGSQDTSGLGSQPNRSGQGNDPGAGGSSRPHFSDSPGVFGDAERRKKMKVADEYVCTDCGTLDSPEWRRGPTGPKTLCNACGLRWAKQEKKRTRTLENIVIGDGTGALVKKLEEDYDGVNVGTGTPTQAEDAFANPSPLAPSPHNPNAAFNSHPINLVQPMSGVMATSPGAPPMHLPFSPTSGMGMGIENLNMSAPQFGMGMDLNNGMNIEDRNGAHTGIDRNNEGDPGGNMNMHMGVANTNTPSMGAGIPPTAQMRMQMQMQMQMRMRMQEQQQRGHGHSYGHGPGGQGPSN